MPGSTSTAHLIIRLFGPMEVRIGDCPLPPLRTRKGLHLLALLALRAPREVQREWLAASLWPDSGTENGYYNLRRTLSDLRVALGNARDCIFAPTPHSLSLAADLRVDVDVTRFDALIRTGNPVLLHEAVELYRGPLLEDWPEEWAIAERESRHQSCLNALQTLASQAAIREDWPEAIRRLKRLAALDPLQEEAQRSLIEAHSSNGDYAAAAMAYRDYRERLHRELNASPSPETAALFRDLQERMSKGVVIQSTPVLRKEPEEFIGLLPRLATSFIGRAAELEQISALLGASRLVTLFGTGGVGKTRMAIRAAELASHAYRDGVWFVDLAPLTKSALTTQAVARTLGVPEELGRPLVDTLVDFLKAKHLLLILDNCEHLITACARLVEMLLPRCPDLHVLATSRQPLGIGVETVWAAAPLTLPESQNLPKVGEGLAFVLPNYEATRLLVERAAEAMPTFDLTERNASAVLKIGRLLDGLPLAIELAAARVRAMTIEQVAARLDNRFRLLTRGNPLAQPRHQTLRGAIDWSYELLSEPQRVLLRRLSVFTGGWSLEAAEAVCEDGSTHDVLDLLTDLIEQSIVVADQDAGDIRRYRMLESIREYGLERLQEAHEEEEMRARHASCFLILAENATDNLSGMEQGVWLSKLEADHENLHAVLEWSLGDHGVASTNPDVLVEVRPVAAADYCLATASEVGLRLICELWSYWYRRGYLHTASHWLDIAMRRDQKTVSAPLWATLQMQAGNIAWRQHRLEDAKAHLQASLALNRVLGRTNQCITALCNLGGVAVFQNDLLQACAYYEEIIPLQREMDDKVGLATSLLNLGAALHSMGEHERALALHEESVALRRELGDQRGIAATLGGMVRVLLDLKQGGRSRDCLAESLKMMWELKDRTGLQDSFISAAVLQCAVEGWSTAAFLFGAAERIQEEIGAGRHLHIDPNAAAWEAQARTVLGEEGYAAACTQGRVLSTDEVIRRLLTDLDERADAESQPE